ncbi:MAG: hypothetical protein M3N54_04145 [Acidobacteriota bacterium]|nr:hypothetical protein [Acidobacteriota bacterium]
MARGWESKSVEAQIEERESHNPVTGNNTHKDAGREREIELLEMTRKRLEREIAFASSRRFREMKQRALSHVESQIKELGVDLSK